MDISNDEFLQLEDENINHHAVDTSEIEAMFGVPVATTTEITPEQAAILDSLEDPDEPEDRSTKPMPLNDGFQRAMVGALLTDAEFFAEAIPHLRGSLFVDKGFGVLVDTAKTWASKYPGSVPPRFFVEQHVINEKLEGDYMGVYDALVAGAKPEHVRVCQDELYKFLRDANAYLAVGKFIDANKKGEGDIGTFIEDLSFARSIGASADAFSDMVTVLSESTGYDWIIDDLLYAGSLNVLSGSAGAGKTVWLLNLLVDVIFGCPVFRGKETHPATVCWLDYDANGEHWRDNLRVALGGRDPEPVRQMLQYATCGGNKGLPQVLTTGYLDGIKKKFSPRIIVIDPLRAAFAGTPKLPAGWENDSGTMTTLLAPFRQWAHENNVAVIFVHHFNRQGTMSGSAAIQACSDVLWNFERPEDSTVARVRIAKRLPQTHSSAWEYVDRRYTMLAEKPVVCDRNANTVRADFAQQVWDKLPSTMSALEEIGKDAKGGREMLRSVVAELNKAGAIAKPSDRKPYERVDSSKFNNCMALWQAEAAKEGAAT